MKKHFLLCISAFFSITAGFAQKGAVWSIVEPSKVSAEQVSPLFAHAKEGLTLISVNTTELKAALATAPARWSGAAGVQISIPTLDGSLQRYRVFEASNFAPELQAQYPDIRSYAGQGIDDPTAHLRLSISPQLGIQTMVIKADSKAEFIEPYTSDASVYAVFQSGDKRDKGKLPWSCATAEDVSLLNASQRVANTTARSSGLEFKTFRLALSCTGEYGAYFNGATGALAAMNNTMTRVNGIFEIDLALNLIIIANTTSVIYTNPNSDPYSNASSMDNWNRQLQNTLSSVIGEENYDIGHLFGRTGGGGNAGCIGCICEDGSKGSGITSPSNGVPAGDTFDVDFVAHEMGHQLGGNHSFSYGWEGTSAQTEPGSGSTIMGYAGVSQGYDIQQHSDAYFTYSNIRQIESNLLGKSCGETHAMTNTDFVVNAGSNYSIPKGTAFVLSGVGMENNASSITYTWEENDVSNQNSSGNNSFPSLTKTTGANFRSIVPSASTVRYFPALSTVVGGELSSTWESVSNVTRSMRFTLTGKDNVAGASNDLIGGLTKTDETIISVRSGAGPFVVTSQADSGILWDNNSQQTITWDVAGTTTNGVNCSQVDIFLSTDGGLSFSTVLASATANDGTETITVPAGVSGRDCRIMVKAANNVFYALNSQSFIVGYSLVTTCNTYNSTAEITIPDGVSNGQQSINVSGVTGAITSVKYHVNASHASLSELTLTALSPTNTSVILWNMQCAGNQNMDVTFSDTGSNVVCASPTTGTYKPSGTLSSFNNVSVNGFWKLRARDSQAGNAGTINSWSVEICTGEYMLNTPDFGLKNFVIYPNPNNGTFTVEFTCESQKELSIMVHDIRGRMVYNNKFANSGLFSGNINLNNAEQGVYLVTVQDGNRKETRKIVVK
jgi:subtilisin-like proprotein convertase family protein